MSKKRKETNYNDIRLTTLHTTDKCPICNTDTENFEHFAGECSKNTTFHNSVMEKTKVLINEFLALCNITPVKFNGYSKNNPTKTNKKRKIIHYKAVPVWYLTRFSASNIFAYCGSVGYVSKKLVYTIMKLKKKDKINISTAKKIASLLNMLYIRLYMKNISLDAKHTLRTSGKMALTPTNGDSTLKLLNIQYSCLLLSSLLNAVKFAESCIRVLRTDVKLT